MEFINPYNFISLSEQPTRKSLDEVREEEKGELLTGSISYTLTTKSPLFIPNTSGNCKILCDKEEGKDEKPQVEHPVQDFFSYTDISGKSYEEIKNNLREPVIPGSEVRGMIRSIYETLTNSCLVEMNEDKVMSRRTVEHFKPGLLCKEDGKISLRKAKDNLYRFEQNGKPDFTKKMHLMSDLKDCTEVTFEYLNRNRIKPLINTPKPISEGGKKGAIGYVLKGEDGPEIGISEGKPGNCKKRDCIHFNTKDCPRKEQELPEVENCWLSEKHCVHVFTKIGDGKNKNDKIQNDIPVKDTDAMMNTLQEVLKAYAKDADKGDNETETTTKNSYQDYREAFNKFADPETKNMNIPVYFSELGDGRVMLSPACITREVYQNTPIKLIDGYKKCGHKQLKGDEGLCPACQLFGMVGKVGKQSARSSKIRFSDLRLEKMDDFQEAYEPGLATLEELASPKPENAEFYLRLQNINLTDGEEFWFWTYDYYTVKKPNNQIEVRFFDNQELQISGRKFYWHKKSKPKMDVPKTKRNKTVRLVKLGQRFHGKLYFDGITRKQLDQILYIFRYTTNGKHGYKLGGGKPLGLGSVQISDVKTSIRRFTDASYRTNTDEIAVKSYSELDFDAAVESAFEFATSYFDKKYDEQVQYPKMDGKSEVYKWFEENKKTWKFDKKDGHKKIDNSPNSRKQIKYEECLPNAMEAAKLSLSERQDAIGMSKKSKESNEKYSTKKTVMSSSTGNLVAQKNQKTVSSKKNAEECTNSKHGMLSSFTLHEPSKDIVYTAEVMSCKKNGSMLVYQLKIEAYKNSKCTIALKPNNSLNKGQEIKVRFDCKSKDEFRFKKV